MYQRSNTGSSNAIAIGARLRKAREAKRWKVDQLSNQSGVGVISIYRIENGSVLARTTTLEKIAPALGVDLDWLEIGTGKGPTRRARRA